jgi:hypothetical protein
MKKILLTLVGSALISSFALQAQQQSDTTGIASESRTRQQDDHQPGQQTDRYQDPYASEEMVIIEKEEIPESLKERLKDKKYEGWENGTIYHNTNTGEYVIAPRAYRFNSQGEEIELGTTTGFGNRDGRESRYSRDDAQPDTTPQPRQPSTGYRDKQNDADANSQSQADHFRTDDMTEIQAEQLPATLRRTLSEKQYEGWEDKGTLYQDPATNEYVLVMDKSGNASQPRAYRFDKNGQLKESQNGTTRMNEQ